MKRGQVEGEVWYRVDEPGDERGLHEPLFEPDRREHQKHAKGEVQGSDIPNEVFVVGAQGRHPIPAGAREVVVERAGQEQGPRPDHQRRRGQE